MMDINYELYKVFYHVATTLNFSEASKQLFISQSAVSQSIKTLERKLDQTLFIRSTKKVQLTPEGEILLRHIEPAMNLIQKVEAQLLDAASTGGQIRIGASDTICRYFLVPYLEKFHKTFPNVHIKVINQTSLRCTELLKNGLVDLIVVNYPNAALNNISASMKIKNFHDVFIAGNITVIDVEDCNLIFSKQTVKRLHNIIKMMDDIISAVTGMTSVKADSQFIILDNSIINPGKFFKIPSDF